MRTRREHLYIGVTLNEQLTIVLRIRWHGYIEPVLTFEKDIK